MIVDVQNDFISGSLAISNCPAGQNGEEVSLDKVDPQNIGCLLKRWPLFDESSAIFRHFERSVTWHFEKSPAEHKQKAFFLFPSRRKLILCRNGANESAVSSSCSDIRILGYMPDNGMWRRRCFIQCPRVIVMMACGRPNSFSSFSRWSLVASSSVTLIHFLLRLCPGHAKSCD